MAQFRAKARAVEMLGKGQIADLSTAILELWKNGYDAYADNLRAALYLPGYEDVKNPLFVLWDDGVGMTDKDILEKWIVLGTDSKSRNEPDEKGEDTLWKEPRIKMGEKGVGRLSVAYLGSPMLMLTKKRNHPLQALFFHWSIFENFNLFLEDIEIPVKLLENEQSFEDAFSALQNDFLQNLDTTGEIAKKLKLSGKIDPWEESKMLGLRDRIRNEVENIQFHDFFQDDFVKPFFKDFGTASGTKFIVFNPNEQFLFLKDAKKSEGIIDFENEGVIKEVFSSLNGFSNIFKGKPDVQTSFMVYGDVTNRFDLVASSNFFTSKDFDECDHLIEGGFDDEGLFTGKIRVYKQVLDHKFRHNKKPGKTPYGAFEIKVGYIAGDKKDSFLNDEQYNSFDAKLKFFGGLYLYRDNFRVLPYGRTESDFLGFEERRSKNAGMYFFSHRRMFGYLSITREKNPMLIDKASREGLVSNKAYREFRADLVAFFIDLAKQYYGRDAKTDYIKTQKDKFAKISKAAKEDKEKEKIEKQQYTRILRDLPEKLKILHRRLEKHTSELTFKLQQPQLVYGAIEAILSQIEQCKLEVKDLEPFEPVRFKPSERQRKQLYEYEQEFQEFTEKALNPAERAIAKARSRLEDTALLREYESRKTLYQDYLESAFSEYSLNLQKALDKLKDEVAVEKQAVLNEFEEKYAALFPQTTDKNIVMTRLQMLENNFRDLRDNSRSRLDGLVNHLEKLSLDIDEDAVTGYYKIKFEELSERIGLWQEIGQLGMAVEIIDHQFNVLYSQLADSIKKFKPYAESNPKATREYELMVSAFQHLEENYKLLTPLYRTSGKIRKEIRGADISDYIRRFFKEDFRTENVKLDATVAFDLHTVYSYESVLIPVFINLVNNALYWVRSKENRRILFDMRDGKIIVANSGESIEDYLLEDIFKPFYSRKPKGRGIGLYVSRTSLREHGFDLIATNDRKYNTLGGACFIIQPYTKNESDDR